MSDGTKDAVSGTVRVHFDDGRGHVGEEGGLKTLLEEQKARFRAKFERDPRPEEPLFFDPECDQPVRLAREKLSPDMVAALQEATVHGAMVFAHVKVGYFLSPMNYDVANEEEVTAWEEAVREFVYLKGI